MDDRKAPDWQYDGRGERPSWARTRRRSWWPAWWVVVAGLLFAGGWLLLRR